MFKNTLTKKNTIRDLHNLSLKTRSNFYLETNILAFTLQNFVDSLSRVNPKYYFLNKN